MTYSGDRILDPGAGWYTTCVADSETVCFAPVKVFFLIAQSWPVLARLAISHPNPPNTKMATGDKWQKKCGRLQVNSDTCVPCLLSLVISVISIDIYISVLYWTPVSRVLSHRLETLAESSPDLPQPPGLARVYQTFTSNNHLSVLTWTS